MGGALDRLVPTIKNIVDKFGKSVDFEVISGGAFDESTGTWTGRSTSTVSVVVTPPGDHVKYLRPGESLKAGETMIGIPASGLSFVPVDHQKVTIDGEAWRVTRIETTYTGEEVGIWWLTLEGGE